MALEDPFFSVKEYVLCILRPVIHYYSTGTGVTKHRIGPTYKSFCMDHSVLSMEGFS